MSMVLTYHIEVSLIASLRCPRIESCVMSCKGFPGTVEIVCHQVDKVQVPVQKKPKSAKQDSINNLVGHSLGERSWLLRNGAPQKKKKKKN